MEAQLFKISNAHAMGPLPPHHVPKLEVLRPSRKLGTVSRLQGRPVIQLTYTDT
jgi:hypothetical protein